MSCCKKFLLILGFFVLEVSDLIFDWEFFHEVVTTEQEIIKNDDGIRYSIMTFAIIGTILFLLELYNLVQKVRSDAARVNPHVVSALSMWIEDFPQIVLALVVAFKEEEVLTWVQYAKAGFAIFEALVRLFVTVCSACRGRRNGNDDSSRANRIHAVTQVIGFMCILIGSFIILLKLLVL